MPYRDNKLILSASQALTADADSVYFLDSEITNPGWEDGDGRFGLVVTFETTMTGTTGITISLVHKATEPTNADGDLCSMTLLVAACTKGTEVVLPFPQGVKVKRMVRCYYNLTNGDERVTVSAYLSPLPVSGLLPTA